MAKRRAGDRASHAASEAHQGRKTWIRTSLALLALSSTTVQARGGPREVEQTDRCANGDGGGASVANSTSRKNLPQVVAPAKAELLPLTAPPSSSYFQRTSKLIIVIMTKIQRANFIRNNDLCSTPIAAITSGPVRS